MLTQTTLNFAERVSSALKPPLSRGVFSGDHCFMPPEAEEMQNRPGLVLYVRLFLEYTTTHPTGTRLKMAYLKLKVDVIPLAPL